MSLEPNEDSSLKIKPNNKLINFIVNRIKCTEKVPENITNLKNSGKSKRLDCILGVDDIRWLNSYLTEQRKVSNDMPYIHELLDGIDLKVPQPKVTQRSPELEERIKKLSAQQNAREYRAMTKGVDSFRKHIPEDTIAYQMKLINKQLIAVVQFIASVMAGFAFGLFGVPLIIGNLDFGFRLLLAIICALVIALAEIYFLAKKLNEDYDEIPSRPVSKKLHQE